MKQFLHKIWNVSLWLLVIPLYAQQPSTAGLTGVRDTSFNNRQALLQLKGKYPQATVVNAKLPASVIEKRNITYTSIGKRSLLLDVFYPRKKQKKSIPAIVIVHGGGWRTGDRSQHIPLAYKLAEAGYVAVTVEYRLSTEALYPAAVHDIKASISWLKANSKFYNVNVNQIAIAGFSAGGQLAALVGTTNGLPPFEGNEGVTGYSSDVQAIIDIDGILAFIHPESGEGDDSKRTSAATYWFGYNKEQNPALWHDASALSHVDKNTPPILFINSSVERMHAGRDDMRKKLDSLHIYSEVKQYPDTPHTFCLFNPWFEPVVNDITTFLSKVFVKP